MKKFTLSFFMVLFIFSTVSSGAFAGSQNINGSKQKVLFEANEVTSIEILEKKALNGISDRKEIPDFFSEGEIISIESDDLKLLETVQTTQKLKTVQTTDSIVNSYATTIFTYAAAKEKEKEKHKEKELGLTDSFLNLVAGLIFPTKVSAASKTDYTNGASSAVKSYSTIYWDTRTSGTTKQYRLTRVSGGWTILDSQFSISNRRVEYGQTWTLGQETSKKYPTSNSFNYYTPSSWGWRSNGNLGATTYVTLKRGTSSWVQGFTNNTNS